MPNNNPTKETEQKKNEFCTQLSDIEKELLCYKEHFKGKVLQCICDDPIISNVFLPFSYQFQHLDQKKLFITRHKNRSADLLSLPDTEEAISLEYKGDRDCDRTPNPEVIAMKPLKGRGEIGFIPVRFCIVKDR